MRICKHCGKDISHLGETSLYCNTQCRQAYHDGRRKKTRKCIICGKDYTSRGKRLVCSDKCDEIRRAIEPKRPKKQVTKTPRKCNRCGVTITATRYSNCERCRTIIDELNTWKESL